MVPNFAIIKAKEHALEEYPQESVGLVVNGIYKKQENEAEDPEDMFCVNGVPPDHTEAIIHSHPKGEPYPSSTDMLYQVSTGVPWGILPVHSEEVDDVVWFGDQVPIFDLLGRKFLHGVADCYSLVRDFYRIRFKKVLPVFPRDFGWWESQDLLSRTQCVSAGFESVDREDLVEGDVVLFQIHCRVANHCGVYLDGGILLHHLHNRLSCREPLHPWLRFVRSCWRLCK